MKHLDIRGKVTRERYKLLLEGLGVATSNLMGWEFQEAASVYLLEGDCNICRGVCSVSGENSFPFFWLLEGRESVILLVVLV